MRYPRPVRFDRPQRWPGVVMCVILLVWGAYLYLARSTPLPLAPESPVTQLAASPREPMSSHLSNNSWNRLTPYTRAPQFDTTNTTSTLISSSSSGLLTFGDSASTATAVGDFLVDIPLGTSIGVLTVRERNSTNCFSLDMETGEVGPCRE